MVYGRGTSSADLTDIPAFLSRKGKVPSCAQARTVKRARHAQQSEFRSSKIKLRPPPSGSSTQAPDLGPQQKNIKLNYGVAVLQHFSCTIRRLSGYPDVREHGLCLGLVIPAISHLDGLRSMFPEARHVGYFSE